MSFSSTSMALRWSSNLVYVIVIKMGRRKTERPMRQSLCKRECTVCLNTCTYAPTHPPKRGRGEERRERGGGGTCILLLLVKIDKYLCFRISTYFIYCTWQWSLYLKSLYCLRSITCKEIEGHISTPFLLRQSF